MVSTQESGQPGVMLNGQPGVAMPGVVVPGSLEAVIPNMLSFGQVLDKPGVVVPGVVVPGQPGAVLAGESETILTEPAVAQFLGLPGQDGDITHFGNFAEMERSFDVLSWHSDSLWS